MRTNILLVVLLAISTLSTAQQFYIEGGKTLSSFDYKNTQGNSLENLQSSAHNFMAFGYKDQLFTKQLNGSVGINYASYGAIGSDDVVGNYMEWDLNYLALEIGLDYKLFNIKKGRFYIKGSSSAGFLIQGTQTINNKILNLKNENGFDKVLVDFKAGFGFSHPISENLSFYGQYMYGKSLAIKEESIGSSSQERLRIVNNNISFGLLINIARDTQIKN